MRELATRGYRTVIITSDANHLASPPLFDKRFLRQDIDGVQLYWVRTMKYESVRSVKRILSWFHFDLGVLRLARRDLPAPAVIVASSLALTTVLVGAWLSWRYRARLIFEVRDIWPLTLTEEGGYSSRNPLVLALALIERFGYRRADAIVGTMPNLVEHVIEVSRSSRPVYCVPMGYESSAVNSLSQLPRAYEQAVVPRDRFLVGYAGSIGTTNAMQTLFDAAEQLSNDLRIHFVIVGGGDLLQDFVDRYRDLPNVTFIGCVPRDSVQAVLAEFDLLYLSAFPSKVWKYGQSLNKLIDYMLAAKPVVASYDGFPSMLNEARSGVFVPAGDCDALTSEIQRLAMLDRDELRAIGERGRIWLLEHRGYPVLATEYEQILFPADQTMLRRE
jgi:glycosyltransferase involved in cell wall biosynthesis